MKKARKKNGFTILDLLSVMVIVGIVAALSVPAFDEGIRKIKFKSAANEVMANLRFARSEAIAKKLQYGVYFDVTNRVVTVFQDLEDPSSFAFTEDDSVVARDSLSLSFETMTTTFADDLIFFFPDGSASSSGSFTGQASWSEPPPEVEISVLAATGRTRM